MVNWVIVQSLRDLIEMNCVEVHMIHSSFFSFFSIFGIIFLVQVVYQLCSINVTRVFVIIACYEDDLFFQHKILIKNLFDMKGDSLHEFFFFISPLNHKIHTELTSLKFTKKAYKKKSFISSSKFRYGAATIVDSRQGWLGSNFKSCKQKPKIVTVNCFHSQEKC